MTQEELDALMSGDLDSAKDESTQIDEAQEDINKDQIDQMPNKENFKVDSSSNWPPPPPDEDHKVVHQLDDVTKESEEKATEIFDIIEKIGDNLMEKEDDVNFCFKTLEDNVKLFTNLSDKFPDIKTFVNAKEKNETALLHNTKILGLLQESGDSLMSVMDIMQYQDIHRQKIERVINVMRALSNYMNALFAGKIDDDKRVGSAVHIVGDKSTQDVVNADDIEALLAQFDTNG